MKKEFARSRRLNEIISSALGGRACAALEDVASFDGALGSSAVPPQPPLVPSSLPTTSGLFRRISIGKISPTPSRPKGVTSDPEGLVREGTGDECPLVGDEGVVLGAVDVRRGLRFCMKVHRFREMCRPGSCVAIRKVRVRRYKRNGSSGDPRPCASFCLIVQRRIFGGRRGSA